ncbi:MAG: ATP-binding cassette domain-containing protein [Candidatus Lokiarchaeota archaeon]|nr:ATP-binding cassette domain-containing protein [Candidatus Lokiarchaeota archaeon]
MSNIAIKASNIGKLYQIGGSTVRYQTLRDNLASLLRLRASSKESETSDGMDNSIWAVRDVSFDVYRGEVVGLIGRNGAGKSTLLKMLARITEPTKGRAEIFGRVGCLLEVGTGFHQELTGRENIFFNGSVLGLKYNEIKRKFDEIVDFAGVEQFLDTPVKRYSSGMQVRLAFAVAAHLDPEILLVDEVLAVGDIAFQQKCLNRVGEIAKSGRTVIVVSHNMTSIARFCSRVFLLDRGCLKYDGDVKTGIGKYVGSTKKNSEFKNLKKELAALPQDPDFELLNVIVIQEGSPSRRFMSNKPISVTIEYRVRRQVTGLRVGFDLKRSDTGITAFRSFHDDTDTEIVATQPGHYVSETQIPAELLAEKDYFIDISVLIYNIRWVIHEQIVYPFSVIPSNRHSNLYADKKYPGTVMPLMKWNTCRAD